jgi:hypothetical protein
VITAAFAGLAVALLRVADGRDADRAAQAGESTTQPSAGFDRQPTGGPGATGSPTTVGSPTTAPATGPDDEGPAVVLRGDGIGAFRFGAEPDQVIVGLTLRWGPPDIDSGWIPAGSATHGTFGSCPGTSYREVKWRSFAVLFSDGATPWGPAGTRHFFTWQYHVDDLTRPAPDPGGNRPPLKTAEGVSVGVTVKKLHAAYGDRLELFDEAPAGPQFGVQTAAGGLFGSVTSLDPSGIVESIVGGGGCGGE